MIILFRQIFEIYKNLPFFYCLSTNFEAYYNIVEICIHRYAYGIYQPTFGEQDP